MMEVIISLGDYEKQKAVCIQDGMLLYRWSEGEEDCMHERPISTSEAIEIICESYHFACNEEELVVLSAMGLLPGIIQHYTDIMPDEVREKYKNAGLVL
jgi:hypothetical protein